MNVAQFAEELSQLIVRWTTPSCNSVNESTNSHLPLTNQQVLDTVQDVIRILLGINLPVADSSSVKTPASGIAVCTPNAPLGPKLEPEQPNLARFRSLDTLTNANNLDLAGIKSEENIEAGQLAPNSILPDEKKFISRSSPVISVSVGRSGTFVRENEANNGQESKEADDVFDNAEKVLAGGNTMNRELLEKLKALRMSATDVVSIIDEIEKESNPHATKPIRRLSSIGTMGRPSTMLRPGPGKLRRSSIGFPGTPTSSKLDTTITTAQKDPVSARRKTVSAATIQPTTAKINAVSPRPTTPTGLNQSAGKKNPKYAHVQSTIPKAAPGAKKKS